MKKKKEFKTSSPSILLGTAALGAYCCGISMGSIGLIIEEFFGFKPLSTFFGTCSLPVIMLYLGIIIGALLGYFVAKKKEA